MRRGAGLNVIFAPGLEHLHDEELVEAGRDLVGLLLQLAENTGRTTADALVPGCRDRLNHLTAGEWAVITSRTS